MAEAQTIPYVGRLEPAPFSVLVFDDENGITAEIAEPLKQTDSNIVDEVHDREDATHKVRERARARQPYDVVVTDVLVDPGAPEGQGQGDAWLLEHAGELEGTHKVVFTGYERLIRPDSRRALEDNHVVIIRKGLHAVDTLIDGIERLRQEKERRVAEALNRLARAARPGLDAVGLPLSPVDDPGAAVAAAASEMFRSWLKEHGERGGMGLLIGKTAYTPGQLSEEVARGSEAGQKVLKLFLRHVRYRLGWESVPTFDQKLAQEERS